jgi:hypothetical protein
MEDEECYAFGLDANKNQITSIASNAGQCLWNGIADQDKAERTVKRLLQADMWSGWGIRTLSNNNPAYNPSPTNAALSGHTITASSRLASNAMASQTRPISSYAACSTPSDASMPIELPGLDSTQLHHLVH